MPAAISAIQQALLLSDEPPIIGAFIVACLIILFAALVYYLCAFLRQLFDIARSFWLEPHRVCRRKGHIYTRHLLGLNAAMATWTVTLRCRRCGHELHYDSTDMSP